MRRSAGNPINFFQNISHLPGQSSLLFCIDLIEYNIKAAIPYSLPSTGFTRKQLCQEIIDQENFVSFSQKFFGNNDIINSNPARSLRKNMISGVTTIQKTQNKSRRKKALPN